MLSYVAVVELQKARLLFARVIQVGVPYHFGHTVDLEIDLFDHPPVLAAHPFTRGPHRGRGGILCCFEPLSIEDEAKLHKRLQRMPAFNVGTIDTAWNHLPIEWRKGYSPAPHYPGASMAGD